MWQERRGIPATEMAGGARVRSQAVALERRPTVPGQFPSPAWRLRVFWCPCSAIIIAAFASPVSPKEPSPLPIRPGPELLLPAMPDRPLTAAERVERGYRFLDRGDHVYALADFDDAVRLDPASANARAGRGAVWVARGEPDKAMGELNDALRLDPDCADAYRVLAAIHFNAQRWGDALRAGDRYIELAPRDVRGYRGRAATHFAMGNHWAAVRDYERALRFASDDAVLWAKHAEGLAWLQDWEESRDSLNRAIALKSDVALWYFHRAVAKHHLAQPEEALADLNACLAHYDVEWRNYQIVTARHTSTQTNAQPQSDLSVVLSEPESIAAEWFYRSAVVHKLNFNTAISKPPALPGEILLLRAQVYRKLSDDHMAIEMLDEVLSYCSDHQTARLWRGETRFNRGEFAAAEEDLTALVRLNPTDPNALAARAIVRAELGRAGEAATDLAHAERLSPGRPGMQCSRGRVFYLCKQFTAAAREYGEQVRETPTNPDLILLCGEAEFWAGHFAVAEGTLTAGLWGRAVRGAPPAAFLYRAVARASQGNFRGAVEDLNWAGRMTAIAPITGVRWPRQILSSPGW